MKYLAPLLKQISSEHPQPVVEESVHMERVPMSRVAVSHSRSNPKDPNRQKIIANAWWTNRVDAPIQLSTVKNQTIKFKDIQERAY
jgi:hypothetical protein